MLPLRTASQNVAVRSCRGPSGLRSSWKARQFGSPGARFPADLKSFTVLRNYSSVNAMTSRNNLFSHTSTSLPLAAKRKPATTSTSGVASTTAAAPHFVFGCGFWTSGKNLLSRSISSSAAGWKRSFATLKVNGTADYEKQVKENSNQSVIVSYFTAAWCGPCQRVAPDVEQLGEKYKILKIDLDSNEELAVKMRISAVPTFVLQDGKTQMELDRIQGANVPLLKSKLEEHSEG
ncbi:unnamed protein product [Amoebophrya sp. A120]|nr:unnamed protein product [Amoebophrya sp. A120]|eukprot:GSA120T00011983001.1